jgi:hypothetical protein
VEIRFAPDQQVRNRDLPNAEVVSVNTEQNRKRKRKSRLSTSLAGKYLVMEELSRRGFAAELGPKGDEILVREGGSPPKPIQVKVVFASPWWLRRAKFVGDLADQITVLVLRGVERNTESARFFVVKNSELAAQFRRRLTWSDYVPIDVKSVDQYEDNWNILR